MLFRFFRLSLLGAFMLATSACHFPPRIYRIDVEQGNILTQESVDQLKPGLTKNEVQKILGAPQLTHILAPQRWDYYYRFKPGNGKAIKEKHLTVYFVKDYLSHIEGDWAAAGFKNLTAQ
jgi:outer membrane protein assembly factor BamE